MIRSHRLLSLLALTLGLASLGCGGTVTTSAENAAPPPPGPPKVEVHGETAIDGGEMDYANPHDFAFTIANTGGMPLELSLLSKNCSCAEIDVPATIAPGAEGKLVVHWTPIPGWTPTPGSTATPTLTADVQTNDRTNKTLHFAIKAHIQPLVRIASGGRESNPFGEFIVDLTTPPISPTEPRSGTLTVFSTKLTAFGMKAECTVPGFEVLPPKPLPSENRLAGYDNVAGYTVEIRPTKDLPIGYSRGLVQLALSNLGAGEADRTITVPLVAKSIGGGIDIASTHGDKAEFIQFKKPKITEEDTASVLLTEYNPPAKDEVTLDSFEPKYLRVDQPERVRAGQWRITAHLPGNVPEAAKQQSDPPMIGIIKLKVAGLDRPVQVQVHWDPQTLAK